MLPFFVQLALLSLIAVATAAPSLGLGYGYGLGAYGPSATLPAATYGLVTHPNGAVVPVDEPAVQVRRLVTAIAIINPSLTSLLLCARPPVLTTLPPRLLTLPSPTATPAVVSTAGKRLSAATSLHNETTAIDGLRGPNDTRMKNS